MTTNELTKIWAKISGLFARKTEVADKADKAVVVTLSDIDQQIVADKTFDEVLALLQGGTEVVFDYQRTYMKVGVFHNTAIAAFAVDGNTIMSILWIKDNGITVSNTDLQEKLVFDNEPTSGSNNPVKSGGVFTALQGKADVAALRDYCPIIEDTRSSAVANITGVAPFASLVDGQMIVLHFAYRSANSSTLTLTLSGGDTTATIPIYKHSYNNVSQLGNNYVREGTFYILIYQASASKWWIVGCIDTDTTYSAITQAEIDAGTSTYTRSVTPKILCNNFDKVTTLVEVTATGDVTQALDSGKFYRFGEVDSLTLTFTAPSAGLGMWGGKFTASASWSALGIPATIDEAAGNDTIEGGKTYEFNMVDNVIIIKEI